MIMPMDQLINHYDLRFEKLAILLDKDRKIHWMSEDVISIKLTDNNGYLAIANEADNIWRKFITELRQNGKAKGIFPMANSVQEKFIYLDAEFKAEQQLIIAKLIFPSKNSTPSLTANIIQLLDYLQQGLVITSTNHSISHFNQYAQKMIPKQTIKVGDRIDKIFLDITRDEKACGEFFDQLMKNKSVSVKYPIEGSNYKISAYFDENLNCNVYIFEDVTLLTDLRKRMASQQYLSDIGKSTAMLVHEMRNPMTSIKGYFDLLRLELEKPKVYFTVIENELNRLEQLCTDILYLSKPIDTSYVPTNVSELLKEVSQLMYLEALNNNVDIVLELKPEHSVYVLANQQNLKQVFINVIKNAIQSIEQSGEIIIELTTNKNQVQITITDNGCGFEQSQMENAFEMFYTTKDYGTGLGLPVVKKIIEKLKGKIEISSTVNIGTTISIYFPMVQEDFLTNDFSTSYN